MITKITAGLASGALMVTMFAGSAFAAGGGNTCTITDNQFAFNKCKIVTVNKTKTVQVNNAFVSNTVVTKSSTGGNEVNKNNGSGDNSVTTGDSTVTVTITNNVNANVMP